MSFKHIKSIISAASTDQTLYTVPAWKEFVLLRTRARYENVVTSVTASSGSGGYYQYMNGPWTATGDTINGANVFSIVASNSVTYYLFKCNDTTHSKYYWCIGASTSSNTGNSPHINHHAYAECSASSDSPVGLTFTANQMNSSGASGTPPTFSSGGSGVPAVSFKIDSNDAFETINIGDNIVVKGQTWKTLYEAGSIIKANATVAEAMAEIMGLEFPAGTWETVKAPTDSGGGSEDSVTITYTADIQRSVVLNATEYTSYGETVYRGDSGQTYQGNTIYIWLYKGNVSGTQYWGATMSPTMPTLNGNDVYSNWYAYSTTLINSDYTEVTGMGWSDVSVSQTSGGSSSSAWGGSNTLVASGFGSIAVPGGFITSPNGTYTYNASTDRYEYADSGDDVLFYINNINEELNLNNMPVSIYYQLWYRTPKTGTAVSESRAYCQTSQTLTSEGTWYDIQGTMGLDSDAVVTQGQGGGVAPDSSSSSYVPESSSSSGQGGATGSVTLTAPKYDESDWQHTTPIGNLTIVFTPTAQTSNGYPIYQGTVETGDGTVTCYLLNKTEELWDDDVEDNVDVDFWAVLESSIDDYTAAWWVRKESGPLTNGMVLDGMGYADNFLNSGDGTIGIAS